MWRAKLDFQAILYLIRFDAHSFVFSKPVWLSQFYTTLLAFSKEQALHMSKSIVCSVSSKMLCVQYVPKGLPLSCYGEKEKRSYQSAKK